MNAIMADPRAPATLIKSLKSGTIREIPVMIHTTRDLIRILFSFMIFLVPALKY